MSLEGLVKGVWGRPIDITVTEDGDAADISGYSTVEMVFKAPSGTMSTKTAAFDTDGTDGVVTYTLAEGDLNESGEWSLQVILSTETSSVPTTILTFTVRPSLL